MEIGFLVSLRKRAMHGISPPFGRRNDNYIADKSMQYFYAIFLMCGIIEAIKLNGSIKLF